MRPRRYIVPLAAALFLGCAHSGTRIEHDEDLDLARFHRIGVVSFNDGRGQGERIAQGLEEGLRKLGYEIADRKTLDGIFSKSKPDGAFGLSLEALADVRTKTSADAIFLGKMSSQWSSASVALIETEMGETVLHGVVKPAVRGEKHFAGPDEVVQETLRIFAPPPSKDDK